MNRKGFLSQPAAQTAETEARKKLRPRRRGRHAAPALRRAPGTGAPAPRRSPARPAAAARWTCRAQPTVRPAPRRPSA
ncbi:hypothetical protein [Phytohabitans flavus]